MSITWSTPAGTLLTCTAGTVVGITITATNAVNYQIISGGLPDGLGLSSSGLISGTVSTVERDTTSTFVVRASNTSTLKDRTFDIIVPHNETALWTTDGFTLSGSTLKKLLLNNDYVDISIDANVDTAVTYSIRLDQGKLPFGMKLDSAGRIYGIPRYSMAPGEARDFPITITASDGVNDYQQEFLFYVIDKSNFEAGNTTFVVDGETVDISELGSTSTVLFSYLQPPEYIGVHDLGTVLADDKQYISVRIYDPDPGMGPLVYSTTSTLPPGLTLDPKIGYIYGNLEPQSEFSHVYEFSITATKTNIETGETIQGTGTFQLTVINQYYNNIIWPNSNLGTLIQWVPSELSVAAQQTDSTWNLNYYTVPGGQIPNGLTLSTSTGHIIGHATTSGNYTFTIAASTANYTATNLVLPILPYPVSFKTFNLSVTHVPVKYISTWVKPFLSTSQRQLWENFINNENIFLPEVLYRADDPSFGLQKELRLFLEFGIEETNLRDYANVLYQAVKEKKLSIGTAKSAIAKDSKGRHVYDVIYVDINDDLEGSKTSIILNGNVYYPGSIDNIRNSLESISVSPTQQIRVSGKHLPKFMTTVYPEQDYGYTKVAVLCYTLPGQSNKILNKIRSSKFNFTNLKFLIDRIVVESSLDNSNPSYLMFKEQPVQ